MEARTLVTDLVTECHMRDLSSLSSNGKDLIPDDVTRKNAANRLLKRCILLGNAFRIRTDPYFVARRSAGMFQEVSVTSLRRDLSPEY